MDSGQKSGYYAAILSGREDRGLWSVSTAKQFASSLCQRGLQVSLFASVSIDLVETLCILGRNVKLFLALVRKELTNCSPVLTLHRQLSFLPLKMAAKYPDFCPLFVSTLVTWGSDVNCIRSINLLE